MVATLLLLPEQCEPMDEFMAIMGYVNQEIENSRAIEWLGQGYSYTDLIEEHHYILESMIYPLMARCNPNQLYVKVCPFHIEIRMR